MKVAYFCKLLFYALNRGQNKRYMHIITIIMSRGEKMREDYYNAFWSSTFFKKRRGQMEQLEELFKHLKKRRFKLKG